VLSLPALCRFVVVSPSNHCAIFSLILKAQWNKELRNRWASLYDYEWALMANKQCYLNSATKLSLYPFQVRLFSAENLIH
ncbi:MAG: hypothetical protein L0387_09590, partial [Acidobacteria bacterium]|nr:hypothetical protein [Acidobacteriota bacterium]